MENKKYLDKVLDHLVRGTKMDYDKEEIHTPFLLLPPLLSSLLNLFLPFSSYCKNTFGLTEEEMEYVWKEYVDIINDKIENEG